MKVDLFFYDEFCCGDLKIPAAEFPRWERCASSELSRITGGKSESSELLCVKNCICEMAEAMYEKDALGGILSENNDGYSVSYKDESIKTALYDIAKRHLFGTDLLYRGVLNEN